MNMVERVARAIYLAYANHPDARWECVEPNLQENVWKAHARAALEAMLEPSEGMVEVGDNIEIDGISLLGVGESKMVFAAMIRHAIEGENQ